MAQERAIQARKHMGEDTVTMGLKEVEELCPDCAETMKEKRMSALKFEYNPETKAFIMPAGLMKGLCKKFKPDPGFFTRCSKSALGGQITDKKRFCAWLHHECLGKWPGESRKSEETETVEFADEELKEINGIEIFAAGTWNGDTFTTKDLDQIISSFDETKGKLKPFIKIGHGDKQSLLAKDELPSAGIVTNLRRMGRKLMADFKNVPKKIYEVIKKKAFDKVSSELFVNINVAGKRHPFALKAVALLGGETPAVHDLGSIMDLYAEGGSVIVYDEDFDSKEYEVENSYLTQLTEEEKTMAREEELVRQIAKLEAEVKTYQQEAAEAEKEAAKAEEEKKKAEEKVGEAEKKAEESEKKVAEAEEEKKSSLIDAKVKEYISNDKIKPYQGKILEELLKKSTLKEDKKFSIKVSEKETKEFNSIDELVDEFVNSDVDLPMEEKSDRGEDSGDDALVKKARKYMEEHKGVSFSEAVIEVSPGE